MCMGAEELQLARRVYCTGYLCDIGVPASDAPMDFSAWFEGYLGAE